MNYVTGAAREPFRAKVKVVYEYFVKEGYFTSEEIAEARRVARGEAR